MVEGEDLIVAPCNEGNGAGLLGCNGTFVTHMWIVEDEVVCSDLILLLNV